MLSRRALFGATAATVAALGLAGCSQLQNSGGLPPEAVVANDVNAIAGALTRQIPMLFANAPAAAQQAVQTALADLQSAAQAVAQAASTAAQKPMVQRIVADVNAILAVAAQLAAPLPPPWPEIVAALAGLLPIIEAQVGLQVPATANFRRMSPAEARATLRRLG